MRMRVKCGMSLVVVILLTVISSRLKAAEEMKTDQFPEFLKLIVEVCSARPTNLPPEINAELSPLCSLVKANKDITMYKDAEKAQIITICKRIQPLLIEKGPLHGPLAEVGEHRHEEEDAKAEMENKSKNEDKKSEDSEKNEKDSMHALGDLVKEMQRLFPMLEIDMSDVAVYKQDGADENAPRVQLSAQESAKLKGLLLPQLQISSLDAKSVEGHIQDIYAPMKEVVSFLPKSKDPEKPGDPVKVDVLRADSILLSADPKQLDGLMIDYAQFKNKIAKISEMDLFRGAVMSQVRHGNESLTREELTNICQQPCVGVFNQGGLRSLVENSYILPMLTKFTDPDLTTLCQLEDLLQKCNPRSEELKKIQAVRRKKYQRSCFDYAVRLYIDRNGLERQQESLMDKIDALDAEDKIEVVLTKIDQQWLDLQKEMIESGKLRTKENQMLLQKYLAPTDWHKIARSTPATLQHYRQMLEQAMDQGKVPGKDEKDLLLDQRQKRKQIRRELFESLIEQENRLLERVEDEKEREALKVKILERQNRRKDDLKKLQLHQRSMIEASPLDPAIQFVSDQY